jgi:hypothetical protein
MMRERLDRYLALGARQRCRTADRFGQLDGHREWLQQKFEQHHGNAAVPRQADFGELWLPIGGVRTKPQGCEAVGAHLAVAPGLLQASAVPGASAAAATPLAAGAGGHPAVTNAPQIATMNRGECVGKSLLQGRRCVL